MADFAVLPRTGALFYIVAFAGGISLYSRSDKSIYSHKSARSIVALNDVNDGERVTVSLTNVNGAGAAGSAAVSLGFLAGDVNSTGAIDQVDLTAIRARAGRFLQP